MRKFAWALSLILSCGILWYGYGKFAHSNSRSGEKHRFENASEGYLLKYSADASVYTHFKEIAVPKNPLIYSLKAFLRTINRHRLDPGRILLCQIPWKETKTIKLLGRSSYLKIALALQECDEAFDFLNTKFDALVVFDEKQLEKYQNSSVEIPIFLLKNEESYSTLIHPMRLELTESNEIDGHCLKTSSEELYEKYLFLKGLQ